MFRDVLQESLEAEMDEVLGYEKYDSSRNGLMSIFWSQKVKLFYASLLANNSHYSGVM